MSQPSEQNLETTKRSKKTKFSDLYSDILLEVFSYLTFSDIVDAFEPSLPSFWTSITEGHVKLFVDPPIASPTIWTKVPPQQFVTLTILFTDVHRFDWSDFASLCSITLENIASPVKKDGPSTTSVLGSPLI